MTSSSCRVGSQGFRTSILSPSRIGLISKEDFNDVYDNGMESKTRESQNCEGSLKLLLRVRIAGFGDFQFSVSRRRMDVEGKIKGNRSKRGKEDA